MNSLKFVSKGQEQDKKRMVRVKVKLFGSVILEDDFETSQRIVDIKKKIQEKCQIDVDQQRLVYKRKPLDFEQRTLQECRIQNDAIIYLMLRLFIQK